MITIIDDDTIYFSVNYYNFKDDSQWISCNQKQSHSTYISEIWKGEDISDDGENFEGE